MANTLIAYFTWSGNSAHLAQRIQRITGGDLFHIRTQQPYPKSYPMTASRAYKELQQHLWPELAAQVSRPEQYDQLLPSLPQLVRHDAHGGQRLFAGKPLHRLHHPPPLHQRRQRHGTQRGRH